MTRKQPEIYLHNCYTNCTLASITIELSWKSSQIEGNTYSLLETERLFKEKEEADIRSLPLQGHALDLIFELFEINSLVLTYFFLAMKIIIDLLICNVVGIML